MSPFLNEPGPGEHHLSEQTLLLVGLGIVVFGIVASIVLAVLRLVFR